MEHGKRFSIRFPLDLLDSIKRYAQEDKRSINSEVIWILQEFSTQRKGRKDAQSVQVPNRQSEGTLS